MGKRIIIYTDGACSCNPGVGGWSAVLSHEDRSETIGGFEYNTTNNRMELLALIRAVQHSYKCGYDEIVINSDSAYVVDSINNKRVIEWKLNNWTTKSGTKVKNSDLWRKVYQMMNSKKITLKVNKVKGHKGVTLNEMADSYAKEQVQIAKKQL